MGNQKFNLVIHMMLGIRQSVRNVTKCFELDENEFKIKVKHELYST